MLIHKQSIIRLIVHSMLAAVISSLPISHKILIVRATRCNCGQSFRVISKRSSPISLLPKILQSFDRHLTLEIHLTSSFILIITNVLWGCAYIFQLPYFIIMCLKLMANYSINTTQAVYIKWSILETVLHHIHLLVLTFKVTSYGNTLPMNCGQFNYARIVKHCACVAPWYTRD